MAGITTTLGGKLVEYVWTGSKTEKTRKISNSMFIIIYFDIVDKTTNETIFTENITVNGDTAKTLYTDRKTQGIAADYLILCATKQISSSGVALDMDEEVTN